MSVPHTGHDPLHQERIAPYIVETPVWHWRNRDIVQAMDAETEIFLKLELFQHTGSFKPWLYLTFHSWRAGCRCPRPRRDGHQRGQPRHCRGLRRVDFGDHGQGGHAPVGQPGARPDLP
ncbi:MAG: hypothetical protein R2854_14105 [Caldilineaceae bacterium]